MKKNICFTIDIEPDFSGLLKKDLYFARQNLIKLENIVKKNDIKLTAFVKHLRTIQTFYLHLKL
jgi:hypothetical protein